MESNNLDILKRVNAGTLTVAEGKAILEKVCNGHHERTSTWKKLNKRK